MEEDEEKSYDSSDNNGSRVSTKECFAKWKLKRWQLIWVML